jgi:methyl-accepting chemotaxis protein
LRAFAHHLAIAGASFAFVAVMAAGLAQLLRWAIPLEAKSSSPQRALAATREILAFHEVFWVSAAVSVIAACVAAIWLGRHITGPLSRFAQAFQAIGAGRAPATIQIRATDYLADELDAFNAMAIALVERERARSAFSADLLGQLDELAAAARGRGDERELAALSHASDLAKRLCVDGADRASG